MWRCESCHKEFTDKTISQEVKFGYVDSEKAKKNDDQYMAFNPEQGWAPLCDSCAIGYITKGE
ncbi:MAG: hypothetical protein AB1599_10190 [Planctomycetota bacterium]